MHNSLSYFEFGECQVIISKDAGKIHFSISHPTRYPTWDEIRDARYKYVSDKRMMVMVLPPKKDYVNVHPNCFQLWEIDAHPMDLKVGKK